MRLKNIKSLILLVFTLATMLPAFSISKAFASSGFKVQVFPLEAQITTVNDPGFSTRQNDQDRQWYLYKANFPEAWDKSRGSQSIVVGVIDTGIDATHEDLSAGQVGAGFNFITKTEIPAGINSDDNGHGTLVAGIIGATANNFRGIAGGAPNVKLIPLKALDSAGSGNSADVAAAIIWAADNGVHIVNMSLGGVGFANDTTLNNAITYAFNKNVLIIAAAGNDVATTGGNLDSSAVYPICSDNGQNMVLGVAATDINDQKALFSNYGKSCIDVSAPGKRILSTINYDPQTHAPAPNSYAYASGTSLATPLVTAEAVLIKAYFPDATNRDIRNRIVKSSEPIDYLNTAQCNAQPCVGMLGMGRINALKAFEENLIPIKYKEGDLVINTQSNQIYYISGGQKQPVSAFVLKQRFNGVVPKGADTNELNDFLNGPHALPNEGTLIKSAIDNTVYMISGGQKRPLTFQVYTQRNIQASQVNVVTDTELTSWLTGNFLSPVEGTLVKTTNNPTVYWVVDGLLHPINYQFWVDRGLNIFPILQISPNDLKGFTQGNAFIR